MNVTQQHSHVKLKKTDVMNWKQASTFAFLLFIGSLLTSSFGFWWFGFNHIAHNFSGNLHLIDILLFAIVTYVVWYQIINEVFSWMVAITMQHPVPLSPEPHRKVAFLTAFVPGKEPYELLENTLKAMTEVEYDHDTWLLDEGNDPIAKKICKKYGVKHYSRKGKRRYNLSSGPFLAKSKGGNYNSWYHKYSKKYDYVAQIDIDFLPGKNFLTKTLGYFRDPEVAFVGSPQIYGNISDSWIAKGAAQQAYGFYGSMQKGFFGNDMQLFIGANHVVRVAAHNSIDGYQGHIVEDHITGMKFYAKKWKSVYVPEILAVGEGPSTWDAYFSQQMRWAYGLIDILLHHSPHLFPKMKISHIINYYLLQQYYFYGVAQVLGILLLSLFFFFGITASSIELWQLLALYVPLLIWQQVLFLWLQRFNIDPQREKGLMLEAKLLNYAAWPIYFMALIGVLVGKRLTYKVTPKGTAQKVTTSLNLFIPHFILGTVTVIDICLAITTHKSAPVLLFWAIINTCTMYSFVAMVLWENVQSWSERIVKKLHHRTVPLFMLPKNALIYLSEFLF